MAEPQQWHVEEMLQGREAIRQLANELDALVRYHKAYKQMYRYGRTETVDDYLAARAALSDRVRRLLEETDEDRAQ